MQERNWNNSTRHNRAMDEIGKKRSEPTWIIFKVKNTTSKATQKSIVDYELKYYDIMLKISYSDLYS